MSDLQGTIIEQEYAVHGMDGVYTPKTPREAYLSKDPNAFIWNKVTGERMRNQEFGALGIDSLYPGLIDLFNGKCIENAYFWLPTRPENINNEGKVNVVFGDFSSEVFLYQYFGASFNNDGEPISYENGSSEKINQIIASMQQSKDKEDSNYQEKGTLFKNGSLILILAGAATTFLNPENQNKETSTRRTFLRRTGVFSSLLGATGALDYILRRTVQPISSINNGNRATHQIIQKLTSEAGRFQGSSPLIDGRTALVFAKTLEFSSEKQEKGGILFGFSHNEGIHGIDSKEKRKELIQGIFLNQAQLLKSALEANGMIGEFPVMVNKLALFMASYDVYEVADPEPGSDQVKDLERKIKANIRNVAKTKYCEEIIEAIEAIKTI